MKTTGLIAALNGMAVAAEKAQKSMTLFIRAHKPIDPICFKSPAQYKKHGARRAQRRMQWER